MARFSASSCLSRAVAATTAIVLLLLSRGEVQGQHTSFCDGELGQSNWACETFAPIPAQVFDGADEFLPLPGNPNPANPAVYKQIAGEPVSFDATTGERSVGTGTAGDGAAAVFALTEGSYFCMLAESNGEAVLFDAPEGAFVSSTTEFPTSTWLSETIEALLAKDTKLKYIVYTHGHWDHIGAAGFVYEHFARDGPEIIASKRVRRFLKKKEGREAPTFSNNRNVPIPDKLDEDDYSTLSVGGLRFEVQKMHAHQAGDLLVYLDKEVPENSAQGITTSVAMIVDTVFPGWIPFFFLSDTHDVSDYYEALDVLNDLDFDVLVGGHLTRLGTKADVQLYVDFFADVLKGAELGSAAIPVSDVVAGTGVADPANPNVGNAWLVFNELFARQVDTCVAYVLDSESRGRDWLAELAGVDVTLRSQCWAVQGTIRIG